MADAHQMDAIARQRGFKDYATWAAWNAQRSSALRQGSNTVVVGDPAGAPPQNWLQHLLARIPIHPAATIGYVSDRYHQATGF